MRVLFITSFYPPIRPGGYGQLCGEIAGGLRQRGHEVLVLTSAFDNRRASTKETAVLRQLKLDFDLEYYRPFQFFWSWRRNLKINRDIVAFVIDDFKPEVILIWSLWGLSRDIAVWAERRLPNRVAYYLAGYWPIRPDPHRAFWTGGTDWSFRNLWKRAAGRAALALLNREHIDTPEYTHVMCVSDTLLAALRSAGLAIPNAAVVPNGIDLEMFSVDSGSRTAQRTDGQLRLLYAGQLAAHKGVHTLIEAMEQAVRRRPDLKLSLRIVGAGHPEYVKELKKRVAQARLERCIQFGAPVPRKAMPTILRLHDALVLPSIYEEPMARILMEALACGLAVLASDTGGTARLLTHLQSGWIFAPEDSKSLADGLIRLAEDRGLCRRLSREGQQKVQQEFSIQQTIESIEGFLETIVDPNRASRPDPGRRATNGMQAS